MKSIISHTSDYPLKNSLETLHHESMEWLNEIAFWEDEIDLLYMISMKVKMDHITTHIKDQVVKTERKLVSKIAGNEMNDLQGAVTNHEHIIQKGYTDEQNYREQHSKLHIRFKQYEKELKQIKQEVVRLLKITKDQASLNEVFGTIYNRRAVIKYQNKPIEKKIIETIIDAGRMVPSAMNKQPCKFYVLIKAETISLFSKQIAKAASKGILKSGLKKIIKTATESFNFSHGLRLLRSEDPIFQRAPVVIFLTSPKDHEWAALDIAMFAQNMMLAAKSLGLESCPVGLAKYVMETEVYKFLNISESEIVQLAIILGYGDEHPDLPKRNKVDAVYF
ncbi:MAG: nitroreductase family protein [Cytophagaceae bacterium]|nr:nitroreductase family protein [Cytophagaceae bacterium]